MKACLASLILLASPACAAVFVLPRPVLGSPMVSIDLNGDAVNDVSVFFHSYSMTIGGVYVSGVSLFFGPDVEIFGTIPDGPGTPLIPADLFPGSILGPSTPVGTWSAPNNSPVSITSSIRQTSYHVTPFPSYTEGKENIFIGFRLREQEGYRYGWVDVQFTDPDPSEDSVKILPDINGIYLGDFHEAAVMVAPIPEPSQVLLAGAGLALMRMRRHRSLKKDHQRLER